MTEHRRPRAGLPRLKAPTPATRRAMDGLHAALESIILDPLDNELYEDVSHYCYLIWEWCITTGHLPWGWCPDRYCSCKVSLSEHEPDTLPGMLDPWEALGPNATRRADIRPTDPSWPHPFEL